jgi:uncharacterized membrane protein YedE/YeeE
VKPILAGLLSGLLFGAGLGIAGMTRADKVIGFLDVAGGWDPTLAFVMVGAIAVYALAYRLIVRRDGPVFAQHFSLPTRRDLTPRLLGGSALFGIGWALGGYCPGPGIVSVASGAPNALAFVAFTLLGMVAYQRAAALCRKRAAADPDNPGLRLLCG